MKESIELAGYFPNSLCNGPGIRAVIFGQGCVHNCEDCFNPHTHSQDGGKTYSIDYIVKEILKQKQILNGVTFSGGDPFFQPEEFYLIAKELKKQNINIWCYTGYTFEEILKNKNLFFNKLINNIDVLVDGKFDKKQKSKNLKFKGSENQRIINVKKSIKSNKIVLIDI